MKNKLTMLTEEVLARLRATDCRVIDVVFSQVRETPMAVILVSCAGKRTLPIVVEDDPFTANVEPIILQRLQEYLAVNA
jgi:hypothetical protein